MKDLERIIIDPAATLRQAMVCIDTGAMQIALVVDAGRKLVGTISDGDVRRAVLRGVSLEVPARDVMNPSPTVTRVGEDRDVLIATMHAKQLHRIPVVDADGRLIGLETLDDLIRPVPKDNIVVLMAGGLGSRLRPLTEDRPKPMILVGGRPILETILLNFIESGFHRFYITVNYMAAMIMEYFGDGSRWGVSIQYIRETEKLGTAGALSLLPEKPASPLIVMNGDLLTKTNFGMLIDFHASHRSAATMCVREYDFQVPYGVVKLEDHRLVAIEEKPVHRFFVNAGIYVLSPEAVEQIPGGYYDMPALFERLVSMDMDASVFPVREYWLDIGHLADLEKANGDFKALFE